MAHLEPIIEPAVEAAGFRLVRLRLMGGNTKTLQIMAERADGTMNVVDFSPTRGQCNESPKNKFTVKLAPC